MIQFNVLAMQQDGKFENLLLTDALEKAAKTVEKYVKEATGEKIDWLSSAGQVTKSIYVSPLNHTVVLTRDGKKTTITIEKHDLAAEEQRRQNRAEVEELFSLWKAGNLSPYEVKKMASCAWVYNTFEDWAMRESKKWGVRE